MYMHQTNNKSMKFYLIWKKSNNEILHYRMKSEQTRMKSNPPLSPRFGGISLRSDFIHEVDLFRRRRI